jgi:heme A synthase
VGDFHSTWGWIAVGISGLVGLYGIVLAALRRVPGKTFWWAVGIAMATVLLQVVLGLLAINLEGTNPGNQHVFYGVVVSFTLAFAYIYRSQLAKRPALSYGLLMLFVMGLGIRGILTFGQSF